MTLGIFSPLSHSLLYSSFPRILNQGKISSQKYLGILPRTLLSHTVGIPPLSKFMNTYIHMCVVKTPGYYHYLVSHMKKSLKIQFQGCLTLLTVAYVNLHSYTMFLINYMLCKFVLAHQNLEGL